MGAAADLLLVDGNPLDDIAVLANSSNIKLVVKHGLLAKVCAGPRSLFGSFCGLRQSAGHW